MREDRRHAYPFPFCLWKSGKCIITMSLSIMEHRNSAGGKVVLEFFKVCDIVKPASRRPLFSRRHITRFRTHRGRRLNQSLYIHRVKEGGRKVQSPTTYLTLEVKESGFFAHAASKEDGLLFKEALACQELHTITTAVKIVLFIVNLNRVNKECRGPRKDVWKGFMLEKKGRRPYEEFRPAANKLVAGDIESEMCSYPHFDCSRVMALQNGHLEGRLASLLVAFS
nr:hypothetical protein Iba_chr08bCG1090 [Ipomoea batatas]